MKIKWVGHACFHVTLENYQIVFDPFNPEMLPKIGTYDISANEVLCSHEHDDHNYRQGVKLLNNNVDSPFSVSTLLTYHDHERGKKRGNNVIHVLQSKNYKIAHLGDLGSSLTPEHFHQLEGLDYLFIPVGGFFTINADEAKMIVDKINPKYIIPMHYKGEKTGFEVLATLDEFTNLFRKSEIKYLHTDELDSKQKIKEKVIVFSI